ncbi:EAL domain-containing protein [Legionella sp. W05-934-2]|uniref:bifunctional diguanylate cyclase/phosphodiesterase n=1 Tax=Legionella sp. W05-934-2 TaxID=1198649 RepID=UPI003462ACDD
MANEKQSDLAEQSLKKVPHAMTFIVILLLGLPAIGIIWGMDFDFLTSTVDYYSLLQKENIELQLRGYFTQTLFQWSAFSLAAITTILILTEYRHLHDDVSLIIALAIIFSGSIDAAHILLVDGFSENLVYKKKLDALIWTLSNSVSGVMLILGMLYLLKAKQHKPSHITSIFLFTFLLMVCAFSAIYVAANHIIVPKMWHSQSILSRPYELIPLLLYLSIAVYFYPKLYSRQSSIMTNCIFLMSITQCVIAMYLMLLSYSSYDSAFNIAYFLKILFYFIPFTCLMLNYSTYFRQVLHSKDLLVQQKKDLQYIASHDLLTNILNRRAFEERLDETIENAKRYSHKFALMVIDLDNLKRINDTLGHGRGDTLIQAFSKRILKSSRMGDTIARLGGDEFALITPTITNTSGVRSLADRLLKSFSRPYEIDEHRFATTASIGIAIYPDDADQAHMLLRNADLALCQAKRTGRNTYEFYEDSLNIFHHQESKIEAHLRDVLASDELSIFYQPIYNLKTQEIEGAEVLLRWDNPNLGRVSPDDFIDVAEKTGLIINIGDWVLNQACKQASKWYHQYNKDLIIAVNLSPVQLTNRNFTRKLQSLLKKYNYPPYLLDLEITENLLMENNLGDHKILSTINELGVIISLDDFGKGYSSLNRLRKMPISTLKIDRDFISDITTAEEKTTLVDVIIELAKQLDMEIIAEGIENQIQLDYLVGKDCSHGQGFYLSQPLSAEDFEKLVFLSTTKNQVVGG